MLVVLGLLTHAHAAPLTSEEMHERYWTLTDVRDHLVDGDLDAAKASVTELRELPTNKRIRRKWRAHVAAVDTALATVADAQNLDAAATGVGLAAAACGECHTASEGGPNLSGAGNVPSKEWKDGQNMVLHRWAMDWMWLGLLDDNQDAWALGAKELDNRPLLFRYGNGAPDSVAALEQRVYDLAENATTTDAEQRGETFGVLVATCSSCHSMLRSPDEATEVGPSEQTPEVTEE